MCFSDSKNNTAAASSSAEPAPRPVNPLHQVFSTPDYTKARTEPPNGSLQPGDRQRHESSIDPAQVAGARHFAPELETTKEVKVES